MSDMIMGVTSIPATGNGIWFIQRSPNGWVLLPVITNGGFSDAYFPASLSGVPASYAYGATAPVEDKVAAEVSAAVESNNWDNFDQRLVGLFQGSLDDLRSPVVQTLYQRMSTSASVQQQILGLSGLIRKGSINALRQALRSAAVFSNYALENGILVASVRDIFRSSDPAALAVLGQAATDSGPNLPVREAAAHALASIHTAPTLPYLAALFDDSDSTLRVEAIGGMASFANGLPMQTPAGIASLAYLQLPASAPYKTADTEANFAMGSIAIEQKEASYLSFWKGWWTQNRASLGF